MDPMQDLLRRLQAVDGVYCPDCDRVIEFEEVVTDNDDRRLQCPACVGECANCHCALAAIYCFVSKRLPWLIMPLRLPGADPQAKTGRNGHTP